MFSVTRAQRAQSSYVKISTMVQLIIFIYEIREIRQQKMRKLRKWGLHTFLFLLRRTRGDGRRSWRRRNPRDPPDYPSLLPEYQTILDNVREYQIILDDIRQNQTILANIRLFFDNIRRYLTILRTRQTTRLCYLYIRRNLIILDDIR